MECFNSLLHKLQEVHEREVEGWQVKIQELSNKKGWSCTDAHVSGNIPAASQVTKSLIDTKRMEELFTKNQQMKEQQRLLTENIKTLENRLRAGLCDRCTVTQEVAKRRQQEFEASQIQSLQHISLLAGEMNNLKKENKRLRDDIRNLKVLERGHSEHSSSSTSTTEVKPNSSPDHSPSSGPMALITMATSRASSQPADGDAAVKSDAGQRTEETEHRPWRSTSRGAFETVKLCASPSCKTERSATRAGERRAQSVEGLDQRPSIPPQALFLKSSFSSASGEVNPGRHVFHAPVPCRPQPIKSSPVTFPWSLSESADWASALRGSLQVQPSPRLNLPRFPNLIPPGQHGSPRRQALGPLLHKQSTLKIPTKEPTVLFRLRSMSEDVESQAKAQEKKEIPPSKAEKVSGEVLREVYEGPLDLSERGKSKSSQTARDYSTIALLGRDGVQGSPDKDAKSNPSADRPGSSPPHVISPSSSSSSTPPVKQEEESTSGHTHKQVIKEQEQREELNGNTEQSNGKKVPVLTISLRPVVVLETLNSALQKQESSNGKPSSPATEMGSSSEGQDEEGGVSGQGSTQGCKRKRASVETETDRDSDTDSIRQERKIQSTLRAEEKSPS